MKVVEEPTGNITLYPFLSPKTPEELERGAFYIAVFPGEVKIRGLESCPVVVARDIAKALYKAAELAEGLAGREMAKESTDD